MGTSPRPLFWSHSDPSITGAFSWSGLIPTVVSSACTFVSFLVAQVVKYTSAMQETGFNAWVGDSGEETSYALSACLGSTWPEEPGWLRSMRLQKSDTTEWLGMACLFNSMCLSCTQSHINYLILMGHLVSLHGEVSWSFF